MKRIALMINSLAGGGAEKVVLTLLQELQKTNLEVELICIEKEQFYELPEGLKVSYLTNFEATRNSFVKFFYVFICAWRLKKIAKKRNLDFVQSHLIRSNYINALSTLMGSKHKTQIVNHMMLSFDKKRSTLGKGNLYLYKKLYSKVDMIVSISEVMRRDLDEMLSLNNTHLVIPNPHDSERITQMAAEEPEQFQMDPHKRYIVSVGRLVARKRVDILIRAFDKVKDLYPDLDLLVLGSGAQREPYEAVVNELGIQERVHFTGHVSNPFAFIHRADIFVLASEDEGLPNIIIESLICATPVISSDCKSGPREILAPDTNPVNILKKGQGVEKGEYGLLFPVGDIDALAEALNMLLSDADLGETYVQKGLLRAQDYFAPSIAQRYTQSFDQKPVLER